MKIFKITFTISLILFSFIIYGQKPVVKLSDKIKLKGSEQIEKCLLATPDGYFIKVGKSGGLFSDAEVFINKYSKKFALENTFKFELPKKNVTQLDILNIKNNMAMLSMDKNSKEDYVSYTFTPIHKDGTVGKNSNIAKFKYERRRDIPDYLISRSEDSTNLAFVAYVDNDNDEDIMSCFVSNFDNSFVQKWNKKVSLKRPQEVITILSTAVNNEGKVYVLYKEYEGDKAKESKKSKDKKNKPAYKLKVSIVSETKDENVTLDLKNFYLTNGTLEVLPDGNMGVFGLFSATKKLYTNGIFTLKINSKTDSVYQVSKKEFSEDDLAVLNDDDNTAKDKGEEGLNSKFKLIDVSYVKDGSSYVTMEENFSYTISSYNGRTYTSTTYYVSKDIIPIKLSPTGEIENIYAIPKRQSFANHNLYNSTIVLVNDEGYHAVYNDDIDNLKKDIGVKKKYISSLGDCVAVMTSISNDGKMKRVQLFEKDDTKAILMPGSSSKISNKEFFFFAAKSWGLFSGGADTRIGTITLP